MSACALVPLLGNGKRLIHTRARTHREREREGGERERDRIHALYKKRISTRVLRLDQNHVKREAAWSNFA